MRVHMVDFTLKPFKAMCSFCRQVEEQAGDSDSPATTCPVIVGEESSAEGSTSRQQSLFVPQEDSEESDENPSVDNMSHAQLNHFLKLRDVSPVRHTLSVLWNTAHKRTKRRYLRKAQQCIFAMLDVLAPENSQELWTELCDRHAVSRESQVVVEGRSEKETELLSAFAESYLNAQHWSTRRQILSLMADKLSLKEIRDFIPTVTSYRYNIARRHWLLHGRAAPLPNQEKKRMRIEPVKLEHFVSFITSPHVIQDVPFGEKLLKLSTGEIIKTPNVIRTMIPEHIVQQYQQYCCETNFEPMSKRTLQRVLAMCSASVRKSLQGLDNFSAQGAEAFDHSENLVDKLVECGKTQQWAREIKQQLRLSKQYLKSDYKVGSYFITMRCLRGSDVDTRLHYDTRLPLSFSSSLFYA